MKILVVCSKNLWRSPTAERIYQGDPRLEVRSAGTSPLARHRISERDVRWADLILVMESKHEEIIRQRFEPHQLPPLKVLHIEDEYHYMDPELIKLLKSAIEEAISNA